LVVADREASLAFTVNSVPNSARPRRTVISKPYCPAA
jgi:hypothetical protein